MNINKLLELNEFARKEGRRYPKKRLIYNKVVSRKGRHFVGIVGARGVGKTVILKQIACENNSAFYLSADTIEEEDLFELVKTFIEYYGIKLLLIDEIHFQKNWAGYLKKIYDFLKVRVVFTSSVSLMMFESSYDLSRRVKLLKLYSFSFNEYLFFKEGVNSAPLTLSRIIRGNGLEKYLRYEYAFDRYLRGGALPFSLEEPDVYPILENILKKIIYRDIPMVVDLQVRELGIIEKVVKFIGKSSSDGVNFSSVSRNTGITKYKAEQYVSLLEKAFVLNVVFPEGANVLKEPKILMCLPYRLLFRDWDACKGEIREDFFAQMLKMKGWSFDYLKTKRGAKTPDFLISYKGGKIVAEVGGRGKGRKQFKGVSVKEKLLLTHPGISGRDKRPLFLLGFI